MDFDIVLRQTQQLRRSRQRRPEESELCRPYWFSEPIRKLSLVNPRNTSLCAFLCMQGN